jgi:hypothetical protein
MNLSGLISAVSNIVTGVLLPLAFTLCLFYFFWGVVKYLRTSASSADAAKEAKGVMIWGIVGLFVAFSVWGIIALIQSELGIPGINNITLPAGF